MSATIPADRHRSVAALFEAVAAQHAEDLELPGAELSRHALLGVLGITAQETRYENLTAERAYDLLAYLIAPGHTETRFALLDDATSAEDIARAVFARQKDATPAAIQQYADGLRFYADEAAGALGVPSLPTSSSGSSQTQPEEPPTTQPTTAEPPPAMWPWLVAGAVVLAAGGAYWWWTHREEESAPRRNVGERWGGELFEASSSRVRRNPTREEWRELYEGTCGVSRDENRMHARAVNADELRRVRDENRARLRSADDQCNTARAKLIRTGAKREAGRRARAKPGRVASGKQAAKRARKRLERIDDRISTEAGDVEAALGPFARRVFERDAKRWLKRADDASSKHSNARTTAAELFGEFWEENEDELRAEEAEDAERRGEEALDARPDEDDEPPF